MCPVCYRNGHYGEQCELPKSRDVELISLRLPTITLYYPPSFKKTATKAIKTKNLTQFEIQCKRKFGIANGDVIELHRNLGAQITELVTDMSMLQDRDIVTIIKL